MLPSWEKTPNHHRKQHLPYAHRAYQVLYAVCTLPAWSRAPSNCGHNSMLLKLKARSWMELARVFSQEPFPLSTDLTLLQAYLSTESEQ